MYSGKIPFRNEYPVWEYHNRTWDKPVEWRDNHVFITTLTVDSHRPTRASGRVLVKTVHGNKYEMFVRDFIEAVKMGVSETGVMNNTSWCFTKMGKCYGIKAS